MTKPLSPAQPSFAARKFASAKAAMESMIAVDNSEPSKDQIAKRKMDKEMKMHNINVDDRWGR